jgi:hypothetical protein
MHGPLGGGALGRLVHRVLVPHVVPSLTEHAREHLPEARRSRMVAGEVVAVGSGGREAGDEGACRRQRAGAPRLIATLGKR